MIGHRARPESWEASSASHQEMFLVKVYIAMFAYDNLEEGKLNSPLVNVLSFLPKSTSRRHRQTPNDHFAAKLNPFRKTCFNALECQFYLRMHSCDSRCYEPVKQMTAGHYAAMALLGLSCFSSVLLFKAQRHIEQEDTEKVLGLSYGMLSTCVLYSNIWNATFSKCWGLEVKKAPNFP